MQATARRAAHLGQQVVVVLGLDQDQAHSASTSWRAQGAVVMQTRDAGGCLRVATSVKPDVIVLDRAVSRRLVHLLKAHPISAGADIQWMPEPRILRREAPQPSEVELVDVGGGEHLRRSQHDHAVVADGVVT
jgi:hypothetical protein